MSHTDGLGFNFSNPSAKRKSVLLRIHSEKTLLCMNDKMHASLLPRTECARLILLVASDINYKAV